MWMPEERALFVHVPKTGGQFVMRLLESLGLARATPPIGGAVRADPVAHVPAWAVSSAVDFSFGFVRHPVGWMESYYNFVLGRVADNGGRHPAWNPGMWHPLNAFDALPPGAWASADAMVDAIYDAQPAFVGRLYRLFLGDLGLGVDFIGKQETMAEDLSVVTARLGHPVAPAVIAARPRINVSRGAARLTAYGINRVLAEEGPALRQYGYSDGWEYGAEHKIS